MLVRVLTIGFAFILALAFLFKEEIKDSRLPTWNISGFFSLESEQWENDYEYETIIEGKDKLVAIKACRDTALVSIARNELSFYKDQNLKSDQYDIYCGYKDIFNVSEAVHFICDYKKGSGVSCTLANPERVGVGEDDLS